MAIANGGTYGRTTRMRELAYKLSLFRAKFGKWRESGIMRKISDFFYSPFFIYAVGVISLGLNILGIDELTYAFLAVAGTASLVVCSDALPAFGVLTFFTVARSVGNRDFEKFNSASYVVLGIFGAVAGLAFLFHLLMNFSFRRLRASRFNLAFAVLGFGLITNGFFFSGYTFRNIPDALKLLVYMVGVYFLLRGCVRPTRDSLRYFAFVCLVHGLTVGAQVLATYFINKPFIDGGFSKDNLIFGWGISNTAGEVLFRDMPLCFYLMCTEKKNNWYYFVAACMIVIAQVFTYARASLLFTLPLFCLCYVLCLIFGKKRAQTLICGAAALVAGIAALVVMKDEIAQMLKFFTDNGFKDRGRFELWNDGINFFKGHPVFGVGLRHRFKELFHNFSYYHNTLIQFTVTGGVVGIGTYLFFRMHTYALFTQKLTLERLFLGVLAGGILCISLLDNFVMYLGSQLFLNFAIVFAEHDLNATLPFAYRRRNKRGYKALY